jgi:hypothetical protein
LLTGTICWAAAGSEKNEAATIAAASKDWGMFEIESCEDGSPVVLSNSQAIIKTGW